MYLIIYILSICVLAFASCENSNNNNSTKEVDIYNVVKEVVLADKGYSNELSKHISKNVFEKTNIYNTYGLNNPNYKMPFKVNFSLMENSQNKVKNMVYVKMIYSVEIKDSQNKVIGGSWNIPITFTVKKTGDDWYIIEKYESA